MGSHKNSNLTKSHKNLFKATKTAIKKKKLVKDKQIAQLKCRLTSYLRDKLSKNQIEPKKRANR